MDWFFNLLTNPTSVSHIVLMYACVISLGVYLGKLKFFGISLGVTFILFVGLIIGHLGNYGLAIADTSLLTFLQDFGLILFVFCIGLQVGPSFFSSFKEGGVTMNLIAVGVVALNIITMLALYYLCFDTSDPANLPMMVGVLCGAITNTPGLGAATEALSQIFPGNAPQIASGYACAYPLGVVGIILATIAVRYLCKVDFKKESEELQQEENSNPNAKPCRMNLEMKNSALKGRTLLEVKEILKRDFVCSRLKHGDEIIIPNRDTLFQEGDILHLVCAESDAEAISAFIGPKIEMDFDNLSNMPMTSRRIIITQPSINGKSIGKLHLSSLHGVNITRVTRAGLELFASQKLHLQVGDRVMVVGPEDAVENVANMLGNSMKRLDHPNIATIFVGILLGLIFGSIPIAFPGMPTPVKLGLAGGPLCVAILIGRFGHLVKLVTYTTTSANLMLREVGLALFLASVGIKAGGNFVETVVAGDGLKYVGCGFLITVLPILIMGTIAKLHYKINYFTLMGLIAGSTTDPPALAFANQTAGNDAPAVGYSTVYPLVMFLRILTAQLIILILCG